MNNRGCIVDEGRERKIGFWAVEMRCGTKIFVNFVHVCADVAFLD